MSETKLSTLQRQISEGQERENQLKKRISVWRSRALKDRSMLKSSILQYERVVREWQKMYHDVLDNGWKLLFVKVKKWYDGKRGVKTF